MKRLICFIIFILALTGCTENPVSTGYHEDPNRFGETLEKREIRMFNIDGTLYYDSGIKSDAIARCGTLDGEFTKRIGGGKVPKNHGECNFKGADGWQSATSITKEVLIDGEWIIFKRFDPIISRMPLDSFEYCYYIKGHMNNATNDGELVVISARKEITYSEVYEPMLSSHSEAGAHIGPVAYCQFGSQDSMGISISVDDVTQSGLTLKIEQFGIKPQGELHTDSRFFIEKNNEGEWKPVEKLTGEEPAWDDIAYIIKLNDITEISVNWEMIYGKLAPGYYRLVKEITDFKEPGNSEAKSYDVHFTVE